MSDEIENMLAVCEEYQDCMTPRQMELVDSFSKYYEDSMGLTTKQQTVLEDIYTQTALPERDRWMG
jgi:hypothetical protein